MSQRRPPTTLSASQMVAAGCWIVGIVIFVGLVQKLTTTAVLWEQRQALERQIGELYEEQDRLMRQLNYVQSNAYIEDTARHDMKLGKPGEVGVIAVPAATPTPARR